ncbi:hypothetical protein SAMN05421771_3910 [Granulicella pectinivorans]|uniref:DUF4239 domain-containing protein n=1 Tax=Granulicella pectinivorans TaxID=474950 RepID=A0A1I6MYZ6_9BACT|nr:hypothetical protein [Granulicella pectinivorans]SFS20867.1 hypothetical protein SAMN05421771_3910 [Granulicella pectinivorans]
MSRLMDSPFLVFLLAFALLFAATWVGILFRRRRDEVHPEEREDLGVVLGATLTLLGLIIGFSFSMAISRYDQRKTLEEGEANAIGTEYLRADLLPAADAARLKGLLVRYTDLRIEYYVTPRFTERRREIDRETDRLQALLWDGVKAPGPDQSTAVTTLVVGGMNDVLNAQGYMQAAMWNRIPAAAWFLLFAVGIGANGMQGYNVRRPRFWLGTLLPLLAAVSFFLIADIDSPRGGIIKVTPENLVALSGSLKR